MPKSHLVNDNNRTILLEAEEIIFTNCINLKVNVIESPEFKLAYFIVTVQNLVITPR